MTLRSLEAAGYLALRDFLWNIRRRETLVWAFVMPVVFFYFVGSILGGAFSSQRGSDRLAVYVPADAGPLAEELLERLSRLDFQVVRLRDRDELPRWDRRLVLPSGMTASLLAGVPATVQLTRATTGIDADFDGIRISRAITAVLSSLHSKDADPAPRIVMSVEAAGRRKEIPSGFEQSVPGSLVFFILMALLTNGVTLTMEREQGILRRLASSPMSRGSVVLGKWGARFVLGAVQVAFALLTGAVLFHVRWGPHLGAVVAVLLAYAALAAVLGMLLGNFGRTQRQVIVFGATASNLLASLGGCWWPIEITPRWSQQLAHVIPSGITMDALHQLMSFGAGPSAVAWHIAVLTVLAAAAGWVLARSFRFE